MPRQPCKLSFGFPPLVLDAACLPGAAGIVTADDGIVFAKLKGNRLPAPVNGITLPAHAVDQLAPGDAFRVTQLARVRFAQPLLALFFRKSHQPLELRCDLRAGT